MTCFAPDSGSIRYLWVVLSIFRTVLIVTLKLAYILSQSREFKSHKLEPYRLRAYVFTSFKCYIMELL